MRCLLLSALLLSLACVSAEVETGLIAKAYNSNSITLAPNALELFEFVIPDITKTSTMTYSNTNQLYHPNAPWFKWLLTATGQIVSSERNYYIFQCSVDDDMQVFIDGILVVECTYRDFSNGKHSAPVSIEFNKIDVKIHNQYGPGWGDLKWALIDDIESYNGDLSNLNFQNVPSEALLPIQVNTLRVIHSDEKKFTQEGMVPCDKGDLVSGSDLYGNLDESLATCQQMCSTDFLCDSILFKELSSTQARCDLYKACQVRTSGEPTCLGIPSEEEDASWYISTLDRCFEGDDGNVLPSHGISFFHDTAYQLRFVFGQIFEPSSVTITFNNPAPDYLAISPTKLTVNRENWAATHFVTLTLTSNPNDLPEELRHTQLTYSMTDYDGELGLLDIGLTAERSIDLLLGDIDGGVRFSFWHTYDYSVSKYGTADQYSQQNFKFITSSSDTLDWSAHYDGYLSSMITDRFVIRLDGCFRAPYTGDYWFTCGSDDGCIVYVDGEMLIDNYELQPYHEVTADEAIFLTAGVCYPFVTKMYEHYGAQRFKLMYAVYEADTGVLHPKTAMKMSEVNSKQTAFLASEYSTVYLEDASQPIPLRLVLDTKVVEGAVTYEVDLQSSDGYDSKYRIEPSSLTFDATNWDIPQTIMVSAVASKTFNATLKLRATSGTEDSVRQWAWGSLEGSSTRSIKVLGGAQPGLKYTTYLGRDPPAIGAAEEQAAIHSVGLIEKVDMDSWDFFEASKSTATAFSSNTILTDFTTRSSGVIFMPETGFCRFKLEADDRGWLEIDDVVITEGSGSTPPSEWLQFTAGKQHNIFMEHYQGWGAGKLKLFHQCVSTEAEMSSNIPWEIVPPSRFLAKRGASLMVHPTKSLTLYDDQFYGESYFTVVLSEPPVGVVTVIFKNLAPASIRLSACSHVFTPDNYAQGFRVYVDGVASLSSNPTIRRYFIEIRSYAEHEQDQHYNNLLFHRPIVRKTAASGSCIGWGDPHYTSFDGQKYDYYLPGDYTLFRDESGHFVVQTRLEDCVDGKASCTTAAVIKWYGDIILVAVNDDRSLIRTPLSASFSDGLRPFESGRSLIIELPDGSSVGIKAGYYTRALMDVVVNVPGSYQGKAMGLCGNFDGNRNNEFYSPQLGAVGLDKGEFVRSYFLDRWNKESLFTYGSEAEFIDYSSEVLVTSPSDAFICKNPVYIPPATPEAEPEIQNEDHDDENDDRRDLSEDIFRDAIINPLPPAATKDELDNKIETGQGRDPHETATEEEKEVAENLCRAEVVESRKGQLCASLWSDDPDQLENILTACVADVLVFGEDEETSRDAALMAFSTMWEQCEAEGNRRIEERREAEDDNIIVIDDESQGDVLLENVVSDTDAALDEVEDTQSDVTIEDVLQTATPGPEIELDDEDLPDDLSEFKEEVQSSCQLDCSFNGDCYEGTCECYEGWMGDACEQPTGRLPTISRVAPNYGIFAGGDELVFSGVDFNNYRDGTQCCFKAVSYHEICAPLTIESIWLARCTTGEFGTSGHHSVYIKTDIGNSNSLDFTVVSCQGQRAPMGPVSAGLLIDSNNKIAYKCRWGSCAIGHFSSNSESSINWQGIFDPDFHSILGTSSSGNRVYGLSTSNGILYSNDHGSTWHSDTSTGYFLSDCSIVPIVRGDVTEDSQLIPANDEWSFNGDHVEFNDGHSHTAWSWYCNCGDDG